MDRDDAAWSREEPGHQGLSVPLTVPAALPQAPLAIVFAIGLLLALLDGACEAPSIDPSMAVDGGNEFEC